MNHSGHSNPPNFKPILLAIAVLTVLYIGATVAGFTEPPAPGGGHGEHAAAGEHHDDDGNHEKDAHDHGDSNAHGQGEAEHHTDEEGEPHEEEAHDEKEGASAEHAAETLPKFFVIPFVVLLGCIALLPLFSFTMHWWESNRNRFIMALVLAGITLAFYYFLTEESLTGVVHVLDHAILKEYIPFIVLLFSLYTISGGIRIAGDLEAMPSTNTKFILAGGLLASFIGTTGAAMLLIRPLLETNRERKHVQHTVVFFIFVVCNCGGCLLPIGDPPLFLGYLKGVPFMWTFFNLWAPFLVVNAILLTIYFLADTFFFHPHETKSDIKADHTEIRPLTFTGWQLNVPLLIGVVFCVALLDPSKPIPGTDWQPFVFLREIVQLILVAISLSLGSMELRKENKFDFHAIVEVAALFVGIFICMQPAIAILKAEGLPFPVDTPMRLFWATGSLSAVLDNAPTYVVFYEAAGKILDGNIHELLNQTDAKRMLIGISLGSVFMGAMTYIGNGPNFMVRAIAEQSGVKMPSFFGYVLRYSLPILLPVFIVTTLLFLL